MKQILFTLFMLLSSVVAWGQHQVNFVSETQDAITLRVAVYGVRSKAAAQVAAQEALKALLFRGIPGSKQARPLINTHEEEAYKAHKKYFRELFDEGRCTTFVLSNVPLSARAKDASGRKYIGFDVAVNITALRTDLEAQSVIRKFGL